MIRAHLASFPPRASILMQTLATILPQVDRLYICLNDYDQIPQELGDDARIHAMIPDRDLKDAGKFAFTPQPDDIVFTIDDDILYPPDYVARTLRGFDEVDPARNLLGYQGGAWVMKPKLGRHGWRAFLFHRRAPAMIKADILGTGTACQLGRNMPELDQIVSAAGFVDQRHARLHSAAGRHMWIMPREQDTLRSNMPDALRDTSLFETVQRTRHPGLLLENNLLLRERTPHSGLKLKQFRRL